MYFSLQQVPSKGKKCFMWFCVLLIRYNKLSNWPKEFIKLCRIHTTNAFVWLKSLAKHSQLTCTQWLTTFKKCQECSSISSNTTSCASDTPTPWLTREWCCNLQYFRSSLPVIVVHTNDTLSFLVVKENPFLWKHNVHLTSF